MLTNQGGGVGNNTLSVVMLIYQYAFAMSGASNYNSASALGVVLMLVLAVFSGGFLWATRERGMAAFLGRLRPCPVLDWKFVALGHNTVRGAAGAAVLNAELMYSEGLLD